MKKTFLKLILIAGIGLNGLSALALETETNSFEVIKKEALSKIKKYGPKNVLVVLDIDNTTLAMPQNFGSDQWFGWQSTHCMGKKPAPDFCVADSFDELLDVQGQIFALSNMVPTEKATVKTIEELQKKGAKVILLTSRGPAFRNATERALEMNGINMRKSPIAPVDGFPSTYVPYTLKSPSVYGLTAYDIKTMGTKKARPVSYMNGVFMTAGLNKGIMLKTLLNKTKSKFKAIIFADDHEKHTKRMQAIMGKVKGVDLSTFRYSKMDPQVKAFHEGDKKEAIAAWKDLKKATTKAFK